VKSFLSHPWVVTVVGGLLVTWLASYVLKGRPSQKVVPQELYIGPFRYSITRIVSRKLRPWLWRIGGREGLTERDVHIEVVNITSTSDHPRDLEATVRSADGRPFSLTAAAGPAFQIDISPGRSARGTLRFVTPSGLVLTDLYLRDPHAGFGRSFTIRAA